MESAANNFSYTAGGVALTGTAVSTVVWVKNRLPETRLKDLDHVFNHTTQTLEKSDAEGLLPSEFKLRVEGQLAILHGLKEEARECTYRAVTTFDQIKASLQGLSGQIMRISDQTKELRAQVVSKSEESRRTRGATCIGTPSPAALPPPDVGGPFPAIHGADIRVFMTEPAIPPIVYCQQFSSQLTLVQSTAYTSTVQPCSQSTVEDASPADTPKTCSFASAMWSRLMEWRSPSLQTPNDIEAGTRDIGVST